MYFIWVEAVFRIGSAIPSNMVAHLQTVDCPQESRTKARESFQQNDLGEAALKQEADQDDEKAKEAPKRSAQELEKLADEVEKDAINSVKNLDKAFAKAYQAMTGHR